MKRKYLSCNVWSWCLLLVLIGTFVHAEEKTVNVNKKIGVAEKTVALEWKDMPKGTDFKSDGFFSQISSSGMIQNLTMGKTVILSEQMLYGRNRTSGTSPQGRWFQRKIKKPLQIGYKEKGNLQFRKSGFLIDDSGILGPEFKAEVTITKSSIHFSYKVKLLRDYKIKTTVFCSINNIPINTLANRGFRITYLDGKQELKVFPLEEYNKATKIHISGIRKLEITINNGLLIIEAEKGSEIKIMDPRSWGSKAQVYRLDIYKKLNILRNVEPKQFPKGTIFQWAYSMSFRPFKN